MFEYLMPSLFFRSEPGTLLAQSERAAVAAQRRFGAAQHLPWGVSESGFASLDADRNYRYRSFGVPGLGLRRGLDEDRVVAPYATVLALGSDAPSALENLRELTGLGLMGEYGLYEAADFTPERVPEGRRLTPVRSYMAHHQGMILAALDNLLCDGALIRRMRADPRVRSIELLLHERVPAERPLELLPQVEPPEPRPHAASLPAPRPWSPVRQRGTALHLLGNGRLSSSITDAGAGGLRWQDYALTRWTPDPSCETQGLWFYVKDEETGEQWPAVLAPDPLSPGPKGRGEESVIFHPHLAEFYRRDRGIGLRMEVAVVPADDVEIRRFTIVNETDRARTLMQRWSLPRRATTSATPPSASSLYIASGSRVCPDCSLRADRVAPTSDPRCCFTGWCRMLRGSGSWASLAGLRSHALDAGSQLRDAGPVVLRQGRGDRRTVAGCTCAGPTLAGPKGAR